MKVFFDKQIRCFIFFRRNEIESEERKRQRVH